MPSKLTDLVLYQLVSAMVTGRVGTPATATVWKGAIETFCMAFKNETVEYKESYHGPNLNTGQFNAGECAEVIT